VRLFFGLLMMATSLSFSCVSGRASSFDVHIRPYTDRITLCYISVLREDPRAAGEININVTVGGDGKVITTNVVKNTFPDDRVGNCVAAVLREISFPANNQNKVVSFRYPIQFLSEGRLDDQKK